MNLKMLKVPGEIQNGHLPNSSSVTELSNRLGSDIPPCQYRANANNDVLTKISTNLILPIFIFF